jgi:hypothetical protein
LDIKKIEQKPYQDGRPRFGTGSRHAEKSNLTASFIGNSTLPEIFVENMQKLL